MLRAYAGTFGWPCCRGYASIRSYPLSRTIGPGPGGVRLFFSEEVFGVSFFFCRIEYYPFRWLDDAGPADHVVRLVNKRLMDFLIGHPNAVSLEFGWKDWHK